MIARSTSLVLTASVFAASALPQQEGRILAREHTDATSPGIMGVWKVTEVSSRAPGENWTNASPQLSLYIFTKRHYSYMFTTGGGPRPLFAGDPNKPTDAEMITAYKTFVAANGTYLLSGLTLTLNATLAKNPNEMMGKSLIYTVQLNGDELRMTITNPPFAPGRERRIVLTRVE